MKHKGFFRKLGWITLLAGIANSGCTLEEVVEHGDVCPGLQYIQTEYGKLNCFELSNKAWDCAIIGGESSCQGNIHCEELLMGKYQDSFIYGTCPNDYICSNNNEEVFCYENKIQECSNNQYLSSISKQCETSTVNFCGSETNDCTRLLGWADGICENNRCIITNCSTGFALKDNTCVSSCNSNEYYSSTTNQCETSTVNFCGSETNDCTMLLGWADGSCENNKCIPSECTTGFVLKDDKCISECEADQYYSIATNQCEASTVNFCGSETNDCTKLLGWADGICNNNKCIITECSYGFALKDNTCVSSCNSNEYYSSTTNQCEASSVNFCGSEYNDCTRLLGWANGSCENNKCIISECTTGFALKDNACVSSCGTNEYYSSTTNQCEASSVNFCGSEYNDCTRLWGWADGSCENNKCIISKCTTGFALKDNACVSSCGTNEYYSSTTNKCERSTVNKCGSETNDCKTSITNWAGGKCENNRCIITECAKGYKVKDNACVSDCNYNQYYSSTTNKCETSTVTKCGSETNDCTHLLGWSDGTCKNNKCIVSKCRTGFTVKDNACVSSCRSNEYYSSTTNQCETSTVNKCGSETNDCKTSITNWAGGKCENNRCIITECATGYKVKDNACVSDCNYNQYYSSMTNKCEASSVNFCGSETNDCTKLSNWAGGKCENNKCIITKCATGYKVKDNACVSDCTNTQYYSSTTNQCEKSTVNFCGSEYNDCTKLSNWAGGKCETNRCIITECAKGYKVKDNACVSDCNYNQYYSSTTNKCEYSSVNFCGSEYNNCKYILGWASGKCENNKCIITECSTGFALKDNACVPSCSSNEYYSSTTNKCETSTVNKCGSETNDCTKAAGWMNGKCENNVCIATSCRIDYHLEYNNCIADSNSNCGAYGKVCDLGTTCIHGSCTTVCPNNQEYIECLNECVNANVLTNYYHMYDDCKCIDGYSNKNADYTDGCETKI